MKEKQKVISFMLILCIFIMMPMTTMAFGTTTTYTDSSGVEHSHSFDDIKRLRDVSTQLGGYVNIVGALYYDNTSGFVDDLARITTKQEQYVALNVKYGNAWVDGYTRLTADEQKLLKNIIYGSGGTDTTFYIKPDTIVLGGDGSKKSPYTISLTNEHLTSGVGSTAWADITGVPTTFTPSAHTHDDLQRGTIKVVKGNSFNLSIGGCDSISNGASASGVTVENTNATDGYIKLTGILNTTGIQKITISGINFIFDVANPPTSATVTVTF